MSESDPSTEQRVGAAVLVASLGLSAALCAVLLYQASPFRTAVLALLVGALVAGLWALRAGVRRGASAGWALGVAVLNLLVVVPELALRAADFSYESGIEFGYPRPSAFVHFVPDEHLFWKLPASRPDVNELGFPGPEIAVPKPEGVYRVVFLGDSCTQQGYPSTAELLVNATAEPGSPRFEAVTLAVSGYSSHQGRVIAEQIAPQLEPDLAFVYFGWNDHWRAWGAVDAEKTVEVGEETPASGLSTALYHGSRLLQAAALGLNALTGRGRGEPLDQVRVPRGDYEANLEAIHRAFAERGVPVVFVTAPSSHERLGVDPQLIELGQVVSADFALELHREYNEVVRRVAARSAGAALLDLARETERLPDGTLRRAFMDDGIHFTVHGLAWVADRVADAIRSQAGRGGDRT